MINACQAVQPGKKYSGGFGRFCPPADEQTKEKKNEKSSSHQKGNFFLAKQSDKQKRRSYNTRVKAIAPPPPLRIH